MRPCAYPFETSQIIKLNNTKKIINEAYEISATWIPVRIKKFFKRGARDNFVLLLTLLCEIHMVEFSRGRGTDLSHPLSSGLTHYILFIIRDYSKSTATLVYCSFKSPRRGFFDKINKKSGHNFGLYSQ